VRKPLRLLDWRRALWTLAAGAGLTAQGADWRSPDNLRRLGAAAVCPHLPPSRGGNTYPSVPTSSEEDLKIALASGRSLRYGDGDSCRTVCPFQSSVL
jgi:hypothetical protein